MREFVIQHGFLPEEFYLDLKAAFPAPPKKRGFRGDLDIAHIDPEWPDDGPWWEFREDIKDCGFWKNICARFWSLEEREYATKLYKRWDREEHEGRAGESVPAGEVAYPRADIGWGGPGYGIHNGGRGTHIDNKTRVISGLLYFTDQSEIEGGEFQIVNADGGLVQTVPVRDNLAILSVQNRDAWHRVEPVRAGLRRWVYFALSDTRNIFDR